MLGKIKKYFTDLKDLAFIAKDGASSTKYLRGDGTWQTFPTIPTIPGVVSTSANGLAPKVTDTSKFLKGDGTWATPTDTNTYDRNRYNADIKCGTTAIVAGNIIVADSNGKYKHLKSNSAWDRNVAYSLCRWCNRCRCSEQQ